ncbi:hypothetical protein QYM36_010115 [Artemia franciscana]|uniref:RRM domain-containing protein n=1 Tax=Artemia franciscana TaxID=6661 RepID=A0AA88HQS0_ARTSF|nr:hypothetical protein QYM36_010115 [Artemia franciscana]
MNIDSSGQNQPDPDAIKMFVGQVPRTMDENDIRNMFEEFGEVYQINVLRDKISGQSKDPGSKSDNLSLDGPSNQPSFCSVQLISLETPGLKCSPSLAQYEHEIAGFRRIDFIGMKHDNNC